MKGLLKKLGVLESIDLHVKMSPDQVSGCLEGAVRLQSISFFDVAALNTNKIMYRWKCRELAERKLHVHIDIYPKHYVIFITKLISSTFMLSLFGLGSIFLFLNGEFTGGFGVFLGFLIGLILVPIRLVKRMQWRVWDLRLDIEKQLKSTEKLLRIREHNWTIQRAIHRNARHEWKSYSWR